MFVVDCPTHGARTLLSLSSITEVVQADGVIDVHLRCWCGGTVVHRTGRNGTAHGAGSRRQTGASVAF